MILTVVEENDDRSLLTLSELRVAYGLAANDTSQDAVLKPLGLYVSAMITKACRVSRAGAIPPTLRLERVKETFRFKSQQKCLILSRRPIVEIHSVTDPGGVSQYDLDASAGILTPVFGNGFGYWSIGNVEVEYSAGFEDVPDDLKYAAILYVQNERSEGSRDPNLKSLTIEGVSSRTWWVNPPSDSVIPEKVMRTLALSGYVNMVLA